MNKDTNIALKLLYNHYHERSKCFTDILTSELPSGWQYRHGVTKGCLIPPNSAMVYKFPIYLRNGTNYIDREMENYQSAVTLGIEKILPYTTIVGTIHGVNIIAQEKIDYSQMDMPYKCYTATRHKNRSVQDKTRYKIYGQFLDDINVIWLESIIRLYGKAFAYAVANWTRTQGINDTHSGNIGYLRGRPVFLDFSGY